MESIFEIILNLPFELIELIQEYLLSIPSYLILIIVVLILWSENILGVIPSDSIILFTGTFVSANKLSFLSLLLACSIGSILGFISMFLIGKYLGEYFLDSNRIKIVNREKMINVELQFKKYGFMMIVVSRFVAILRAPITFFAGLRKLNFNSSTLTASISGVLWYAIWIYLGMKFGDNYEEILILTKQYGLIFFILIVTYFMFRTLYKKR